MCGIAGLIDLSERRPLPLGVLGRMADTLIHRGPDEEGTYEQPGLGLASRRLSILDLADGRQPMSNEDGSVWVVFNGELFDYPELRADLVSNGHRVLTHCDTEAIPHLWEQHGEGMFERLRGQFAFALWDERQQRLILARDRFGICPLYWTTVRRDTGTWLLFGSEIKALLASEWIAPRVDPRGINQLFTFLGVPGPVTCFEGVQSVQPGHFLSIHLGAPGQTAPVHDRTYWQIDFPDESDQGAENDPRKLADQFEAVLYRAVERRLRADVPVVSYLSGGVDSSIVVAMASRILGTPIPTFTVQVEDRALDETAYAALVARQMGTESVIVPYSARRMLQTYPRLVRAAEAPVIDTSAAATLLMAEQVHGASYKVALTGEGSDEWFGGYPWFHGTRFLQAWRVLPRIGGVVTRAFLRWWMGGPAGTDAQWYRAEQALGGPNVWLIWTNFISMSRLRFFSPEMQQRLSEHEPFADLGMNLDRMSRWHPMHRGLGLGARTMLPGLLLAGKGDRVAMHSSVETRYPFLDEEVFTFLAGVHPRWKMRGFTEKYLLKRVAERWLPRSIAWRRKAMFRAPLDPFHSRQAPRYVDQLLSPESLRSTGYFDPVAVQHWRERYRQMHPGFHARVAVEMGLVGVVATQLWHHQFIDSTLADLPNEQAAIGVRESVPT
ncbi:MAG: asparagine synthase (glutamine-hydrolyzing) [Gemmataceae bacterium]|nr:asparagine synthase (glutamine-hydrolyzing) [Gemmataceae bacterium]